MNIWQYRFNASIDFIHILKINISMKVGGLVSMKDLQ